MKTRNIIFIVIGILIILIGLVVILNNTGVFDSSGVLSVFSDTIPSSASTSGGMAR